MSRCCLSGFKWDGTPTGKESKLGNNNSYVAGFNKDVAILIIHDIFGWTSLNSRLLADHFAGEVDATVYMPDFYEGKVVTKAMIEKGEDGFTLQNFLGVRHAKEKRFPEIDACAKALRQEHGFKKIGAIGYCWGGWAVFRLGGKGQDLVDCISTAHPSILTKEEINNVAVPVQILAPEHDPQFTPELKAHCNETIPTLKVPYDYQYFPGLSHGFAGRCDQNVPEQKKGMERAKNAAVTFFAQFLHLQ